MTQLSADDRSRAQLQQQQNAALPWPAKRVGSHAVGTVDTGVMTHCTSKSWIMTIALLQATNNADILSTVIYLKILAGITAPGQPCEEFPS